MIPTAEAELNDPRHPCVRKVLGIPRIQDAHTLEDLELANATSRDLLRAKQRDIRAHLAVSIIFCRRKAALIHHTDPKQAASLIDNANLFEKQLGPGWQTLLPP